MDCGLHLPDNGDSSSSNDAGSNTGSVHTARTSLGETAGSMKPAEDLPTTINPECPLKPAIHADKEEVPSYTHVIPPFPIPGSWSASSPYSLHVSLTSTSRTSQSPHIRQSTPPRTLSSPQELSTPLIRYLPLRADLHPHRFRSSPNHSKTSTCGAERKDIHAKYRRRTAGLWSVLAFLRVKQRVADVR